MKKIKLILTFLFAVFIIFGGINHFLKPSMYLPFIPNFLPKELVNYASGVLEILIGIGLLIPKYRFRSAQALLLLMIAFLPIHVWDVFRDDPAIGSHSLALVRLPFQFLFIAWAWFITKRD
ncbi:MAG TPA: DoxX family protein [Leptospiraceae bacterium]|nr:DoxX family protein [Leptospiraceae bacterium]HMW05104.1 DoxX family protein [Leptospiraceae bacterium]HMX31358.1 DoxX family protein [Leptospiraceae bacterium]HMY31599.1 DoxX family protein [Leptospiraceae bacterium]HMZ66121.1 DoxX family protein [Leptospiraceae bacterium]